MVGDGQHTQCAFVVGISVKLLMAVGVSHAVHTATRRHPHSNKGHRPTGKATDALTPGQKLLKIACGLQREEDRWSH